MKSSVLLVGLGNMGKEYARVLKALDISFISVGRGSSNASAFEAATGTKPVTGGIENYIKTEKEIPRCAIVAVNVTGLYEATLALLNSGVKKILVEKPGALYREELDNLLSVASKQEAEVFVAYNRRFYDSVTEARKIIVADGGVDSFQFEFTEWSYRIEPLQKDVEEKARWFLSNSSHVADLAFFLGGKPSLLTAYTSGSLSWHETASVFSGAGVSQGGALFSYSANWDGPGRWGVEVVTRSNRIILRPLEMLQLQKKGSIAVEQILSGNNNDTLFKPGLFSMVKAFLNGENNGLCSLNEQREMFDTYLKISNYR